jgi:hypothetical protein
MPPTRSVSSVRRFGNYAQSWIHSRPSWHRPTLKKLGDYGRQVGLHAHRLRQYQVIVHCPKTLPRLSVQKSYG